MNEVLQNFTVVMGACLVVLMASYGYFRRYALTRPAIGVMDDADLLVNLLAVIATPLVYLSLPAWGSTVLLVPTGLGIIYLTLQPVASRRGLALILAVGLVVVLPTSQPRRGTAPTTGASSPSTTSWSLPWSSA